MKKNILIDLDGVLNNYKGDYNAETIPEIKEGAKNFIEYMSQGYDIKIFTTRNKLLVAKWLIKNQLAPFIIDITDRKELSWIYIDDRCISFNGNFEELKDEIKNFKPWYKRV